MCERVFANLSFTEFLFCVSQCETDDRTAQPYAVLCVCVVYVYSGSHRIIDTEFDDGLMVVTKGGWGAWFTEHFLVLACRRPALGERAPSLHPPSQTLQPPLGSAGCFRANCNQIKVINHCCIGKKPFFNSSYCHWTADFALHCCRLQPAAEQCAVLLR